MSSQGIDDGLQVQESSLPQVAYFQHLPELASKVGKEIHSDSENRVAPLDNHLRPHKKILGVRRVIFWVILALVVLVLGGAVGGGVGGSLASNSKKATSSSSIATITVSVTATTSSSTPTSTPLSCPASNSSIYAPPPSFGSPDTFIIACNTNWPAYADYGNPDVKDLQAYHNTMSLEACIDYCVDWNLKYGDKSCQAVGWVSYGGNTSSVDNECYLKNQTGLDVQIANQVTDSAKLKL